MEIYVEEEKILGNLDINSKLGVLIYGVVNSFLPFFCQLKAPDGCRKVFFFKAAV